MADFYDTVLAQLRYATDQEKAAVRAELEGHVEDHAAALMEGGMDLEEARAKALNEMGDPEEIGKGLAKSYTRFWRVLGRVAAVGIAFLCAGLLLWVPLTMFYPLSCNLSARNDPENSNFAQRNGEEGWAFQAVDLRQDTGDDILYIYKVGLNREKGEAEVYFCNYDPDPLGRASSMVRSYVTIASPSGEESFGGSGGGNTGAFFWRCGAIPVTEADDHLTLTYRYFGTNFSAEIPLDWGEER